MVTNPNHTSLPFRTRTTNPTNPIIASNAASASNATRATQGPVGLQGNLVTDRFWNFRFYTPSGHKGIRFWMGPHPSTMPPISFQIYVTFDTSFFTDYTENRFAFQLWLDMIPANERVATRLELIFYRPKLWHNAAAECIRNWSTLEHNGRPIYRYGDFHYGGFLMIISDLSTTGKDISFLFFNPYFSAPEVGIRISSWIAQWNEGCVWRAGFREVYYTYNDRLRLMRDYYKALPAVYQQEFRRLSLAML